MKLSGEERKKLVDRAIARCFEEEIEKVLPRYRLLGIKEIKMSDDLRVRLYFKISEIAEVEANTTIKFEDEKIKKLLVYMWQVAETGIVEKAFECENGERIVIKRAAESTTFVAVVEKCL